MAKAIPMTPRFIQIANSAARDQKLCATPFAAIWLVPSSATMLKSAY